MLNITTEAPTPEAAVSSTESLPRYMVRRGGVLYFRRKVPKRYASLPGIKRWEVPRSLRTGDVEQAMPLFKKYLAEFEEMLADAIRKSKDKSRSTPRPETADGEATKYLLLEHVPLLLERYEFACLETDDLERSALKGKPAAIRERQAFLDEALQELRGRAAVNDFDSMDEVAQHLLTNERLIGPPGTVARQELLRQLLVKDIEVLEMQIARLAGRPRLLATTPPPPARDMPTFSKVHEHWGQGRTNRRTTDTYRAFVLQFEQLVGEVPLVSVKRWHAEQLRDELAERGLKRVTVKNVLDGLSTLFRFAESLDWPVAQRNPFEGLFLDMVPETPKYEERRAYELTELSTLFNSPVYTNDKRPGGQAAQSSYWAPLMGPFVGARLEEVAQLLVDDVQCIEGVWAIRIANLEESQALKNDHSFRTVPIHDELLKCGILAYVESVRSAGHKRLFAEHKNDNNYKRWGNALGKWYSRYIDQIGLVDERLSYHSFRYTFKQQCAKCGIDSEVRDALTGHWVSRSTPGRGYLRAPERQYPFPALVAAIRKLSYSDLDLSHLYRDA